MKKATALFLTFALVLGLAACGMGRSVELLADMAGTGDWQDGQRFSSGASSDDVQSWVNGLGL